MTRYTLAVTWEDGRTERHPVPEPGAGPEIMATGAPVITLGPVASGIGPERIPVYRPDGPTIAVCEVWGAEYPGIILGEADADRDAYLARFGTRTEAVRFEEQVLAIGSEFLPAHAIAVRDGAEPSPKYWAWLCDQHAAVETEAQAQAQAAPEAEPRPTSRPLADRIRTASERLREHHAAQLAEWHDLAIAMGRAMQAAAANDTAETRRWLIEAETFEYDLLGSCDETGRVVETIDGTVTS